MRLSYRVRTEGDHQWADLTFQRHPRGDEPAWWRARLVTGEGVHLDLGWTVPSRSAGWTAIASKPASELGVDRALVMHEGFRTRYDAAHYLLKLHGVVRHRDE